MSRLAIVGGRIVTPERILDRGWLLAADGLIAAVGEGDPAEDVVAGAETVDATGRIVSPGFIDLHVHGGGGGDPFAGTLAAIRKMTRFHAAHGTTAMLVTTGAMPQEQVTEAVRLAREASAAEPDGTRIIGAHLEGPYLSKRFKGAQPEINLRPASIPELEQLLADCPGFVRLVTLAPEEPSALEAVAWLRSRGILVALGHTDATYDEAERAIGAGVSHSAHTFNGMRGFHHREPGALGAVLLDDRVTAELIMDDIHVRPEAARLLVRMKGLDRVCLVTDAVQAAGLPDGESSLLGLPIQIVGGAARLPDGTLAGSTLTLDRAVANMVQLVGLTLGDAIGLAALNPARVLGIDSRKGSLVAGKDADIVILDDTLATRMTIVGGRIVYRHD